MVSTPSRSRASTRISLPNMARPISARSELGAGAVLLDSVVLLINLYFLTGIGGGRKKPTAVSSRGFLSKISLFATSADGVVQHDDNNCQGRLSNKINHWPKS